MSSTTFSYNSSCSDYVRQRHEDVAADQLRRRAAFRQVDGVKVEGEGINDTVTGALNEFLVKVDRTLRPRSRIEMRLVDDKEMDHPIYQEEVYGVGYRGRYVVAVPGIYTLYIAIDTDDGDFYGTVGSIEIHVDDNRDLLSSLLETSDLLLQQVQEKSRKMNENKKNLRAEQAKTALMLEKLKHWQAHFDITSRSAMLSSIEIGKFRAEYVAETLSPRASRENSPTPPVNRNPPPPPSSNQPSDIAVHTGDPQSPVGSRLQDSLPIDAVNISSPVERTSRKRKSSDDSDVLNKRIRCVPSTLLPTVGQVSHSLSSLALPPVPLTWSDSSTDRSDSPPPRSRVSSPGSYSEFLPRRTSTPRRSRTRVQSAERDSPTLHQPTIRAQVGGLLPVVRLRRLEERPITRRLPVVRLRRLEERPTSRYNLRWLYKKNYNENDNEKDCEEKVHKRQRKRYALRNRKRPDYREKEEDDV